MGTSNPLEAIPRVIFPKDGLEPGTQLWTTTAAQVVAALEQLGCFEAILEEFTLDRRDAIFSVAKDLFALPIEAKQRCKTDRIYDGYLSFKPESPYESIPIDDAVADEAVGSFTKLMWPQGNPDFYEIASSYAKMLDGLDKKVRRMVVESLGLGEEGYKVHVEETTTSLRFAAYGPIEGGVAKEMIKGHTDWCMTTMIHQSADGLQVMGDGRWIPVKALPNSICYVASDSLQAWTNGRIRSCNHRVVVSGDETRYSVLVGSVPKYNVMVRAPQELIDAKGPPKFKPFYYTDYMKFAVSEAARQAQAENRLLQAYCGTDT